MPMRPRKMAFAGSLLYSALRADHGANYAERFFLKTSARRKKVATP